MELVIISLSEMEATKDSFKNVLKKAQNLGYAEPSNPKFDLNGYDAMAKIRILSSLSFNKKISKFKMFNGRNRRY